VITIASAESPRSHRARRRGHKTLAPPEAEVALVGKPANDASFRQAAEAALRNAKPQSESGFKNRIEPGGADAALRVATNE